MADVETINRIQRMIREINGIGWSHPSIAQARLNEWSTEGPSCHVCGAIMTRQCREAEDVARIGSGWYWRCLSCNAEATVNAHAQVVIKTEIIPDGHRGIDFSE